MTNGLACRYYFGILFLLMIGAGSFAENALTHQELLRRTQELFDGVTKPDSSPWQKYYAEDCLFFDEKGRSLDKAALINDIEQLPEGYVVVLKLENAQSRIYEQAAIFSYDINEDLTIFGQRMGARFHFTDTWLLRDCKWQIQASQGFRYYGDPAVGEVDAESFSGYAGTYELTPGRTLTILLDGKNLYYQRGNNPKDLLLPEAPGIFFRKGVEGRVLFHRNKKGEIDSLISRRNHEDLIWRKIR